MLGSSNCRTRKRVRPSFSTLPVESTANSTKSEPPRPRSSRSIIQETSDGPHPISTGETSSIRSASSFTNARHDDEPVPTCTRQCRHRRSAPGPAARGLTALCLLLAAAGPAAGDTAPGVTSSATLPDSASLMPVGVSTRVDRSTAQIADRIALTLVVRSPAGVQISFPAAPQQLGEFGSGERSRDSRHSGRGGSGIDAETVRARVSPLGQSDDSGCGHPLGRHQGDRSANGVAQSEPVDVSITSLLEGQVDPTQFRDIKGIVALQRPAHGNTNRWLVAAAMGTLLAAAVALVIRRQRNTPLSPEQWARQEIRRVETQSAADPIDAQAFYVQLTTIVRIYIEGKVGIAARG